VGIRETLEKKKSLSAVAASVLLAGSLVAIFVQARSMGPAGPGDTYYTDDDGQNFFVADSFKLPPFDHGGKQAVRAHVFECGGKRVVGYMSRYTDEAKKLLDEAKAAKDAGKPPPNVPALARVAQTGTEIKRPGDKVWVRASDMTKANKVRIFRCPDGSAPPEVFPD
jgi:hypothetical protein